MPPPSSPRRSGETSQPGSQSSGQPDRQRVHFARYVHVYAVSSSRERLARLRSVRRRFVRPDEDLFRVHRWKRCRLVPCRVFELLLGHTPSPSSWHTSIHKVSKHVPCGRRQPGTNILGTNLKECVQAAHVVLIEQRRLKVLQLLHHMLLNGTAGATSHEYVSPLDRSKSRSTRYCTSSPSPKVYPSESLRSGRSSSISPSCCEEAAAATPLPATAGAGPEDTISGANIDGVAGLLPAEPMPFVRASPEDPAASAGLLGLDRGDTLNGENRLSTLLRCSSADRIGIGFVGTVIANEWAGIGLATSTTDGGSSVSSKNRHPQLVSLVTTRRSSERQAWHLIVRTIQYPLPSPRPTRRQELPRTSACATLGWAL